MKQNNEKYYQFEGNGEVYSWTRIYDAPTGFEKYVPYVVALIKLKEGQIITAQLTDLGDIEPKIGMKVEMVTRILKEEGDRGIIIYGYKFRPT